MAALPENHNKPWTDEQIAELLTQFCDDVTPRNIAANLQRTVGSIQGKLEALGVMITQGPGYREVVKVNMTRARTLRDGYRKTAGLPPILDAQPQTETQPVKETTMTRLFDTQHLLNGNDITKASDADIFKAIAKAEAEIAQLESIKTKPKRLINRINELKGDLEALVKFIDDQDEKEAGDA